MIRNSKASFGLVSKALHWSMAFLLTGLFAAGLYMTRLDYYDPLYHSLPWWHKSFGLLILFLLLIRLIWNVSNPKPDTLTTHKNWEVSVAHAVQNSFYLLILLIGTSGYFISTAKGKAIELFTFFKVAAVTEQLDEERADFIGSIHETLAILLATLVVFHALAALKHHFLDQDETLKRMLKNRNQYENHP